MSFLINWISGSKKAESIPEPYVKSEEEILNQKVEKTALEFHKIFQKAHHFHNQYYKNKYSCKTFEDMTNFHLKNCKKITSFFKEHPELKNRKEFFLFNDEEMNFLKEILKNNLTEFKRDEFIKSGLKFVGRIALVIAIGRTFSYVLNSLTSSSPKKLNHKTLTFKEKNPENIEKEISQRYVRKAYVFDVDGPACDPNYRDLYGTPVMRDHIPESESRAAKEATEAQKREDSNGKGKGKGDKGFKCTIL